MKKILVPTDFSECAGMALKYAVYLAKKLGAKIKLIHVCDLLDDNFNNLRRIIREYNKEKIAELTTALEQLKKSVEKDDVAITTELYNGAIVDSIIMASQEHQSDLIIMGTLGATGLKKLFFGTKAAAVINESLVPVITIPYRYKKPALKKIMMAVSNAKLSPKILEPVFNLGKLYDAKFKAVVFTDETEKLKMSYHAKAAVQIKKRLEKQFPWSRVESVHISGTGFHESIQEYAKKDKADLLVMITHRRNFIQNLFHLSMTRQMAYHINIPLLSLKENDS